jgi:polynucleotide 5'-hydroxyl-kinase GRC3/NOL9
METMTPKEWYPVLDVLEKEKGIAILLGATDTGKSTLAKFLIFNLCQRGLKIGLVDADIGQSFLGPPTTIGFSVFKSHPDWEVVLSPPEIFFVGSTTPEGYFPIHLKGIKRMVDKAPSYGAEVIIVDTTGFIFGEAGKELKRRKIELLSPQFILALQRFGEVENILELYKDHPLYKIRRLPLSENVRSRPMEERRNYRAIKFQTYFKESETKKLMMEGIQIEGEAFDSSGFPISKDWALQIDGLLIGLKDLNDDTLALGVIKNFFGEEKVLRISTPLRELERVKMIQLSSLKLTPSYEEERF